MFLAVGDVLLSPFFDGSFDKCDEHWQAWRLRSRFLRVLLKRSISERSLRDAQRWADECHVAAVDLCSSEDTDYFIVSKLHVAQLYAHDVHCFGACIEVLAACRKSENDDLPSMICLVRVW